MTKLENVSCSLIISVYKNTLFLDGVLKSLKEQTFRDFEVIVSEDGDSVEMRDFLNQYDLPFPLLHLTQEDIGWRKNRALNRAIQAANCDWLVFIDGDCVLHSRFMEFHWKMAEEQCILAGKRIKLDEKSSNKLLWGEIQLKKMNGYILRNFSAIKKRGGGFVEEGLFIEPKGLLGFLPSMRKMRHLKGCNMSFHRKAIEAINGFDEDYVKPAVGEDADLLWRFQGLGYQLKSLRNLAVQYHLYHVESWTDQEENLEIMRNNQKEKRFVCLNGLVKINQESD
ncbi:glycosyltransferase [Algoriphagus sp. CAU 1675]|uniref:glycosyltransferase n=1 Tax=Algoriphagus sp. CAU 1675 TaxID=3032597 RepID=UPI0023DA0E01|nr:glycosyltransferase [Algoriphagus sp. CAU 1675]MDF2157559.1 glycosyltransferase [Algoriphagus sp. CAU 1675]